MTHRVLYAIVWLALAASPALAAGGEEHGGGEGLLWPLLNFALLVGVLFYLTRKPIQAFFAERRRNIQSELGQAAELQRQAEERHAKWQRRLVDIERELDEIRRLGRERAEAEREQILADARESAARIERTARSAIEQELRRARETLRDEASNLAVDLASGLLRERVTDADRDRLLDEFIARVEQTPSGSAHTGDR
ncbi:MAG TPA: ATP synthase F0 subunit B [Myxococcota bacterium]|nr:ATP synthase F0 subunit B [Myxococcota bacterium]